MSQKEVTTGSHHIIKWHHIVLLFSCARKLFSWYVIFSLFMLFLNSGAHKMELHACHLSVIGPSVAQFRGMCIVSCHHHGAGVQSVQLCLAASRRNGGWGWVCRGSLTDCVYNCSDILCFISEIPRYKGTL